MRNYFKEKKIDWFTGKLNINVKPLNNNYYDLSQVETLQWQSELAQKYEIDGFVFYHYYFKNGKKELEKPAELLLIFVQK